MKPYFVRKSIKNLIARIATMKATTFPIKRVSQFSLNNCIPVSEVNACNNLYPEAAAMVGTARKNENSAAVLRDNFCVIPPTIVAIETLAEALLNDTANFVNELAFRDMETKNQVISAFAGANFSDIYLIQMFNLKYVP